MVTIMVTVIVCYQYRPHHTYHTNRTLHTTYTHTNEHEPLVGANTKLNLETYGEMKPRTAQKIVKEIQVIQRTRTPTRAHAWRTNTPSFPQRHWVRKSKCHQLFEFSGSFILRAPKTVTPLFRFPIPVILKPCNQQQSTTNIISWVIEIIFFQINFFLFFVTALL